MEIGSNSSDYEHQELVSINSFGIFRGNPKHNIRRYLEYNQFHKRIAMIRNEDRKGMHIESKRRIRENNKK